MHKKGFPYLVTHPSLVVWYDMYENHILYIYFLIYFPIAIMLQCIKIRIKIGVYWICEGAKLFFFTDFLAI